MTENDQGSAPTRLVLVGTTTTIGPIGYGEIYRFEVSRGDAHVGAGVPVFLCILAGDERAEFVRTHQAPQQIEIELSRLRENEPYAEMPITGFVDDRRTSWVVEAMRAL